MRINARINPEEQDKLEALKILTGKSTSEVVREALTHYYELKQSKHKQKTALLSETGFIGVGSDLPELSEQYKRYLDSWSDKA